jgi:hypothetical protein
MRVSPGQELNVSVANYISKAVAGNMDGVTWIFPEMIMSLYCSGKILNFRLYQASS